MGVLEKAGASAPAGFLSVDCLLEVGREPPEGEVEAHLLVDARHGPAPVRGAVLPPLEDTAPEDVLLDGVHDRPEARVRLLPPPGGQDLVGVDDDPPRVEAE